MDTIVLNLWMTSESIFFFFFWFYIRQKLDLIIAMLNNNFSIDNFIYYQSTSDSGTQSSRDVFKPSMIFSFATDIEDKYRVSTMLLYSSSLRITAFPSFVQIVTGSLYFIFCCNIPKIFFLKFVTFVLNISYRSLRVQYNARVSDSQHFVTLRKRWTSLLRQVCI